MYTKTSPYLAKIKERELLSKEGSSKKTYRIVLDVKTDLFSFQAGDSVGVIPSNDPEEVQRIIDLLQFHKNDPIFNPREATTDTLFHFLRTKVNLQKVTRTNFKRFLEKSEKKEQYLPYFTEEQHLVFSQYLEKSTLLDVFEDLRPKLDISDFTFLQPLLPRFYSIANSLKVEPNEIHLLVGYVEYEQDGKLRKGVGSHFLCDLAELETTDVPIYLQPAFHFTLPDNPSTPIIMIGPGTGIAPYRAFLQERKASGHKGKNWLFFGERNRACDFYYESFLKELQASQLLHLDLAFSRDLKKKVYVQHKMYQSRKSLWKWIEEGAHLYVCGDAKEMAKDVEKMLLQIFASEGNMSEETARLFLKGLRLQKRYLLDVY